jgi:hypothetical protein
MRESDKTITEIHVERLAMRRAAVQAGRASVDGQVDGEPIPPVSADEITALEIQQAKARRRGQIKRVLYVERGGNFGAPQPEAQPYSPPAPPTPLGLPMHSPEPEFTEPRYAAPSAAAQRTQQPPRPRTVSSDEVTPPTRAVETPTSFLDDTLRPVQPSRSRTSREHRGRRIGWVAASVAGLLVAGVAIGALHHRETDSNVTETAEHPLATASASAHVRPWKHHHLAPEQTTSASAVTTTEAPTTQSSPSAEATSPAVEATPTPVATVAPPPPAAPPVSPAPPAPTETTITKGPTTLVNSIQNIEHIGPDSYGEWTAREDKALAVLEGVDIAEWQEVRPDQLDYLRQHAGDKYGIYPDPSKKGQSYSPNIIIWDKSKFRMVNISGYSYKYFGGADMVGPIGMLQSKETGQIVRVLSVHIPADTGSNGMHNEDLRNYDVNHLADVVTRMEQGNGDQAWTAEDAPDTSNGDDNGQTSPIILGGDLNLRYAIQPHDTQNEPLHNDPHNLPSCAWGDILDDALAVFNHMSKQDLCSNNNQMSNNGGGPVDHSESWGLEIKDVQYDTTAQAAGSDHKPEIVKYVIPAETVTVPVGSQKQLVGASK